MADIKQINVIVSYEAKSDKFRADQAAVAKEAKGLESVIDRLAGAVHNLTEEQKKSNQEAGKTGKAINEQGKAVDGVAEKTDKAAKSTGLWSRAMEFLGSRINNAIRETKEFGSELLSSVSAMIKTARASTGMAKGLAIVRVGFTLLLGPIGIIVTALAAFFTQTQAGLDFVKKAFAGLGAAINVIVERVANVGAIFKDIFSGEIGVIDGIKKITTSFAGMGDEIARETREIIALQDALNNLNRASTSFILTQAAAEKQIADLVNQAAKLKLTNPTQAGKLIEQARNINDSLLDQEITLARKRAQIDNERLAKQKFVIDSEREANAQLNAELFRLETQKLNDATAFQEKINESNQRAAAERKQIADEEAREAEQRRKDELEAERSIRERRISLIKDDLRRSIEQVKESAKQQKEAAKGSDELVKEQRILIEKQALQEIEKLREEHNKKILEEELKLIQAVATQKEEAAVKQREADEKERNRTVDGAILAVQREVLAKTKTEEEGAVAIARIQIEALKEQIKAAEFQIDEKLKLEQELVNAEIALQQSLTAATKEEQDERRENGEKAIQSVLTILEASFDREADRIAKSIQLQEKRVQDVTNIASTGNAELLQLEEQRLRRLQEQQAAAVKKQRALQAIQIAGNATLAVSEGIVAVIAGFKKGPIAGIASALALAATLAAAIAGIRSALSDVPAFREGVNVFQGKGNATSDSNVVRISTGERVVDAGKNAKLVKMGVTNDNIVKVASLGMAALQTPKITEKAFSQPQLGKSNQDYKDLKREIKRQTLAIQNLGVSARIDADGFTAELGKRNRFKERRKNLLR